MYAPNIFRLECQYVHALERNDCGHIGITAHGCIIKGCCWSPLSESEEGPWCYYHENDNTTQHAAHTTKEPEKELTNGKHTFYKNLNYALLCKFGFSEICLGTVVCLIFSQRNN